MGIFSITTKGKHAGIKYHQNNSRSCSQKLVKWAINIMGTFDDSTNKYTAAQLEEMFEVVGYKFEPMKVVGVAVKSLPDDHIIIDKKEVKRRTGKLGMALDKRK
jgi:hypothetical protein